MFSVWDRIGFCAFGLINNVTYVIFLSAANDLINSYSSHSAVSEGTILLADILPSLIIKASLPHIMHRIPYLHRIIMCTLLSMISLWLVSFSLGIEWTLLGIVLASASSGMGELSFLSLCSFYDQPALASWSIGTGLAGVLGSLVYWFLTSIAGVSMSTTMRLVSILPVIMLLVYVWGVRIPSSVSERDWSWFNTISRRIRNTDNSAYATLEDETEVGVKPEALVISDEDPIIESPPILIESMDWRQRLKVLRPLIMPYMLPLLLVFWSEYTINQGILPVLLFPLDKTPFTAIRDHYVVYQVLYQVGVFISRSSIQLVRIRYISILSLLQCLNLILLLVSTWWSLIPSVWIVFVLVLWEGLLGGACYVNAFDNIRSQVDPAYREFAMGACSLADTVGIFVAALTSMIVRPILCQHQVNNGNTLCRK
jgi:battenin